MADRNAGVNIPANNAMILRKTALMGVGVFMRKKAEIELHHAAPPPLIRPKRTEFEPSQLACPSLLFRNPNPQQSPKYVYDGIQPTRSSVPHRPKA